MPLASLIFARAMQGKAHEKIEDCGCRSASYNATPQDCMSRFRVIAAGPCEAAESRGESRGADRELLKIAIKNTTVMRQ